ncbi:MAG: hypothetical protein N3E49_06690 [Bacteroidia bacterium]|nr:hypothetical protein [Bacteroidia bacterium]
MERLSEEVLWFCGKVIISLALLVACTSSSQAPPSWWEYAQDTTTPRYSLLGQPIQRAKAVETVPYYQDSLGYTFQYPTPVGGKLWVEYYSRGERIYSVGLLWESDSFSQMTDLYQLLRQTYTARYGSPQGKVGDLEWRLSDTSRVVLRLSPERRYLHASFSLTLLDEDIHQNR